MWQRYRHTFRITQFTIALMCAVIFFSAGSSGNAWPATLIFFVLMQGFALIGVAWATRLKRRLEESASRLPLHAR